MCDSCAEPDVLEPGQAAIVREELGDAFASAQFKRGRGCNYCNHSGYQGRIGVYELVEIDDSMAVSLHQGDPVAFGVAVRTQPGYQSLRQSAMQLAARGQTTMDQVMRATFGLGG